jgi:amidase
MTDDFAWMDATAQAEAVRAGDATPIELVEGAIARIEKLNPQLNAVIHRLDDKALTTAADPALPAGPFRGVPFLVKDGVCHTAGDPFHCGMQVLKDLDWHEQTDTWLAERFRAAGFVFVGKTNLPELASSVTTEPLAYGATHNPWNLDHSPGGSSGGAAAAVAAGIVAVAHGNDMGGSIRVPASACGLVGLKPTRARTTLGPEFGEFWGPLTHEHVLTRSVRDTAAVLDAIAGPGPGDPYSAPLPAGRYRDEVGADPGRLRIVFTTRAPTGVRVHPDCVAAVRDAAALCEALGHVVVEAAPALDGDLWVQAFTVVWSAGCAATIDGWAQRTGQSPTPDLFEPYTWALQELGRRHSAATFLLALQGLQRGAADVARFFQQYDLWLTPTLAEPPVPLGSFDPAPDDPLRGYYRGIEFVPFTPIANVTGQPAMSVPLFWNSEGLPIGTHFVARYGDEATLFRLAAQLEAARPWADRRPVMT